MDDLRSSNKSTLNNTINLKDIADRIGYIIKWIL